MTNSTTEQLFRNAADAEGGMSVSAGARIAHLRLALDSGRAVTVDLSEVPQDRRSSLVALIRELVKLTSEQSLHSGTKPISDTTKTPS